MALGSSSGGGVQVSAFGLRQVGVLQGLPDAILDTLARECTWRRFEPDQFIITRDADDHNAYFIISGRVRATMYSRARKQVTIVPGALLAVGLQVLLGYGYVFYLSKVGVDSAYQAGLSIIGVTMIALYLASVALLVGAELNHVLAKTR